MEKVSQKPHQGKKLEEREFPYHSDKAKWSEEQLDHNCAVLQYVFYTSFM